MKPTIPETGTVLRLGRGTAVVLLKGGAACKGCGAGKIGLCRPAGHSMVITAKNTVGARAGDTVSLGIERRVQRTAYFLAYLAPLLSLLAGSFCGHLVASYFPIPFLDVATGVAALIFASAYCFARLRKLDSSSMMTIERVIAENIFDADVKTDEELRYDWSAPNSRA